jgi:acetyl esterase
MPLDPQAQAVLEHLAALGARPFHAMTVAEARRATASYAKLGGKPQPVHRIEDATVPGPGGPIPLRTYTPAGKGPFAALVFFHGGAWVTGSIKTHDPFCRALAHGAGCLVAAVEYRLAPEHKHPAAVEDCYAVTRWVANHATELNVDPLGLAVGGDSAGGTLATVVARWARDRGGPPLVCQLLLYPVTDYLPDLPSRRQLNYLISNPDLVWAWGHYLTHPSQATDPDVAPLHAASLSGLPPALVVTAEFDPLRDEGELYAARLREAGVPTTLIRYEGMIHSFLSLAGVVDRGQTALAEIAALLRAALGSPSQPSVLHLDVGGPQVLAETDRHHGADASSPGLSPYAPPAPPRP